MSTPTRDRIANLPPYTLADLDLPGCQRIVQLAQNELSVAPGAAALAAAAESLKQVNRYPDTDHTALRAAIAAVHDLNPEQILCGAGSLELMSLIATAYCEPGIEVVVSQYGYKFFQVLCSVAGADLCIVPEPAMRVDIDAIAAAVNENTRLVFVVNPGNPTGTSLPTGAVQELRRRLPPEVMLVLDGAYAEFADSAGFENGFDLVDRGDNLVVLRTFSKAYGLAGMRIGWCYAPPDVITALQKIRVPNSVTAPALAAAEAAVRDRRQLEQVSAGIHNLRRRFCQTACELGLRVVPSSTNFVLFEVTEGLALGAGELDRRLRDTGIVLRPMGSYDLPRHLRITMGTDEEMAIVESALARLLG